MRSDERRKAPRVNVNLPARWKSALARQEGAVTNLSTNGCFVLTGGKVEPRDLVWLEIDLPGTTPVYLWAEVVESALEIGFAVRFDPVDNDEHKRLAAFIAESQTV